jgi:hypothetical protein
MAVTTAPIYAGEVAASCREFRYILCQHHHPSVPNRGATHEHILREHRKHMLAKAAEQRGRPSS